MENHGCINGTMEGADFSSPPVIGLYIATGSAVCMFLMLFDIVAGLRAKKRWLPCKLLPLNSVTLSLLSVVAKLPVDLTTAMPSNQDQLSKLSGTTLVCVVIGFIMPSMGDANRSEWIANMTALSIFVITLIVNICIQISTGVIVLFIPEHIVIICCMSVLLVKMWVFSVVFFDLDRSFDDLRRTFGDGNNEHMKSGSGSMFQRVKQCYAKAYRSSTPFVICKHPISAGLSGMCLFSSVVFIQSTVRSVILKQLEFCSGTSDYNWSMSAIVATQTLTVVVGCFGTTFRWLSMYPMVKLYDSTGIYRVISSVWATSQFGTVLILGLPLYWVSQLCWYISQIIMCAIGLLTSYTVSLSFFKRKFNDNIAIQEFKTTGEWLDEWIVQKRIEKMNAIIAANTVAPCNSLIELLSRISLSQRFNVSQVSTLHVVLLVSIARVALPDYLCASLVEAFSEVVTILDFVCSALHPNMSTFDVPTMVEQVCGDDIRSHEISSASDDQSQSELCCAIKIITRFRKRLPSIELDNELTFIIDYISSRSCASIEDVYASIEQLFVDIMHALFAQLPNAILRSLREEFAENYEANISIALSMLCQVELLEDKFQWSFPGWCNISRLISQELLDTEDLRGDPDRAIEEPPDSALDGDDVDRVVEDVNNDFTIVVM